MFQLTGEIVSVGLGALPLYCSAAMPRLLLLHSRFRARTIAGHSRSQIPGEKIRINYLEAYCGRIYDGA